MSSGFPRVAAALLLLFFFSLAEALAPPKGVTQVTQVEGITEYRLDNGLRVLLFPDASKPTVTVNITYEVGSRHENYGETGMAHLLEHLLFKDTPTHKGIPGEMKKRGIGFNASTWLDRTNYFASFAADDAVLDWVLDLEADRMVNSPVKRSDLDSEMTVVRNEMERGENEPFSILMERLASTAYLWHNYGKSTIGARSDVENMPIERLQAFYHQHYRPDNATLLVAGRIDPDATLLKIADRFGKIARPQTPIQKTYTRDPAQDGERSVTIRRVGETRYIGLAYHGPAGRHADAPALALLSDILGNTPTGRLHKALVEGKLATFVAGIDFELSEPGYVMFAVEAPKDGDYDALRSQLIALVEDIASRPVTQEELDDAKRRSAKSTEQTINDANRLAMALSESIAQGDWRLFFLDRDRTEAVTLADVNRVATTYFKSSNRTLGEFIPTASPERSEITEAPSAEELLKGYTGRAAVAAGEAFDPSTGNIDARTRLSTLGNGTKLALLSKRTRGATVMFNMKLYFGKEADLTDRATAADLVGAMLQRGTTTHSRADIARLLDGLKAQVNIGSDAQSVSISGQTLRDNLPATLDLVAEMLEHPAFPESEFEQLRTQSITDVESQMTDPQAIAFNALNRYLAKRWPKGHPNHAESFDEQLASLRAVTLDQVKDFYREFYGAGSGEIVVVGDFDEAAIGSRLESLFGTWTSARPYVRIPTPWLAEPAVVEHVETPDKANATWVATASLPLSDTDKDYVALVVGNYVLGGGAMKSRLADRIRVKDGLSYGVGAQFNGGKEDANSTFFAFAIAAPENIEKVNTAFDEELARLLKDGITAEEFKDAVDGLLKSRQTARGEDRALTPTLRDNRHLDRTMAFDAAYDEALRALTLEQVNEAMRRQFGTLGISRFMAGDFAKVKAKAQAGK